MFFNRSTSCLFYPRRPRFTRVCRGRVCRRGKHRSGRSNCPFQRCACVTNRAIGRNVWVKAKVCPCRSRGPTTLRPRGDHFFFGAGACALGCCFAWAFAASALPCACFCLSSFCFAFGDLSPMKTSTMAKKNHRSYFRRQMFKKQSAYTIPCTIDVRDVFDLQELDARRPASSIRSTVVSAGVRLSQQTSITCGKRLPYAAWTGPVFPTDTRSSLTWALEFDHGTSATRDASSRTSA